MYVKSLLSFIFIEILSFKDKRFFNAKKKITKSGKLNLKLLDCPWTHGAQYLFQGFTLWVRLGFISNIKMLPVIQSYKAC